jgi:8-oxo-dGTP pyrophosphatase MutT (NUDIX family)/transcriptional regulator with XRE-family HTH domain
MLANEGKRSVATGLVQSPDRVQYWRLRRELTVSALAAASMVGERTIQKLESERPGDRPATTRRATLQDLANALDVRESQLYSEGKIQPVDKASKAIEPHAGLPPASTFRDVFSIGKRRIRFVERLYCGDEPWREGDGRLKFKLVKLEEDLPDDLAEARQRVHHELQRQSQAFGWPYKDNPGVRLVDLKIENEEFNEGTIVFAPTSYYKCRPFRRILDTQLPYSSRRATIREKYFRPEALRENCVPLQVHTDLVFRTADNKLAIQQRGAHVAVDPNMYGNSVGGSINLDLDVDEPGGCPSPYQAAIRETEEEANLEIDRSEIKFRRIAIGYIDPTVSLTGEFETPLTAAEVESRWSRRKTKEGTVVFIDATPEAFADFLNGIGRHRMFDVVEYPFWSYFLGQFDQGRVEQAANSVHE